LRHSASKRFWQHLADLPEPVQQLAREKFDLLKANPRHPSLHFKRIRRFWAARVGTSHRALGIDADDRVVWFWIGTHAEYDRLVG
jgi:hypothetical protein